jgi:hypothetical protein
MIDRDNLRSQCQPSLAPSPPRDRPAARFPTGSILATTMHMRPLVRHPLTLCLAAGLALALGVGCNRQERHGVDHLSGAPNLGGRTVDADGVAHTQVDVRDVLQAGEAVTGTLPSRGILAGYELEAFRGGEITAELEVFDRGGPVGLAFYGPRTTTGLWDSALTESGGETPGMVSITTEPLSAAGTYLVLVWADDRDADARFELRLSCKGNCGAPQCPNLEPCDLVCDFGFVLDADACRTCACQDAPQCGDGVGECGDGLICGDDGRCTRPPPPPPECTEVAPVCDTRGQTWPNACAAEAAGRVVDHDGRCVTAPAGDCDADRPCTPPLVCTAGRCVQPECTCPAETSPVCSVTGETYRNLCELTCREGAAALDHAGPCGGLTPCRRDGDCRNGQSCEPVLDPANLRRCNAAPNDPACQRVCVMAGESTTCGPGLPACADGQICYAVEGDMGPCAARCRLGAADACPVGLRCADVSVDGLAEGEGVCLPGCVADGPRSCPPGFSCVPDDAGENVCQGCDCPRPGPGEEVCTDQQQQFPSACLAECAHARTWRAGRCGDQPTCDCPLGYAPVCAPDGSLVNRCEARCELPVNTPLRDLTTCLPPGTTYESACVRDEDCHVGGCGGSLCAASVVPAAVCPTLSDELTCYAESGRCGCVNNRCAFEPSRDVERCVDALPAGGTAASTPDFPMGSPDAGAP